MPYNKQNTPNHHNLRNTQSQLDRLQKQNSRLQQDIIRLQRNNDSMKQQFEQVRKDQTEYLQNVSHQLVAPLTAIKWHIENLTEGRLGIDRIRKVLRSIYSQATISVHLSKNFALMSNLEADHKLSALREPPKPVDLCHLMVNLALDFQPLGWDRDLRINVIHEPLVEAPEVLVIIPLISQVFSNIIENALKYSKSPSEINIYGNHDPSNDTVSVSVANTGIPLPTDDEHSIFERGYRSKKARSVYPAGTGFGLYIAKRIVDIHQGTIQTSIGDPDLVIFTVTLPTSKGVKKL